MKTIEVPAGSDINNTIASAVDHADREDDQIGFFLNGIKVVVARDSDPRLIYRDWQRCMSGFHSDVVGPYPPVELSLEQRTHDAEVGAANKRRQKAEAETYRKKEENARAFLSGALREAPEFAVRDADAWAKWQASNQDGYGKGVIDFAERWGRLMQGRMSNGKALADVADECSGVANVDGISGFMYGAAVSVLASCWEHGEELRRWHNLTTQIKDEGERANESGGVLSPALLSIG